MPRSITDNVTAPDLVGERGSPSELGNDSQHTDRGTRCEPGGQTVVDPSATAFGLYQALPTQYAQVLAHHRPTATGCRHQFGHRQRPHTQRQYDLRASGSQNTTLTSSMRDAARALNWPARARRTRDGRVLGHGWAARTLLLARWNYTCTSGM